MTKYNNILEAIGNTPHIKINQLFLEHQEKNIEVWLKLEKSNPGGSIKDRIALSMVEDAEHKKILKKGTLIIEPTSGNTGIGLAMVCAVKGYSLTLVMPESMSMERRQLLKAYGANLVLTAKEKGMKGAIDKAEELLKSTKNSWMPMQFQNEANVLIHKKVTALEVINDFPDGLDYLITGVGTGGHITGLAKTLKKKFKKLKVIAVEPASSPVLSGGTPGPHPIQGIGAGFIPTILKTDLIDEILTVTNEEAFHFTKELALKEGILAGISTGATLAAINKKMPDIKSGKKILAINYDTGERYLSIPLLFND